MDVRNELISARRRAGLTQRRMAALAGVADTTVARIERGDVDPSVGTLSRLLAVVGKSLTVVEGAGVASPTLPGVLGPSEALELHRTQVRDVLATYDIVGAFELPVPAEPDVLFLLFATPGGYGPRVAFLVIQELRSLLGHTVELIQDRVGDPAIEALRPNARPI